MMVIWEEEGLDQDDAMGNDKEGDKDLLKLEFGCNNNQRDGACDDAEEHDGFHRSIKFVLRIGRWERIVTNWHFSRSFCLKFSQHL